MQDQVEDCATVSGNEAAVASVAGHGVTAAPSEGALRSKQGHPAAAAVAAGNSMVVTSPLSDEDDLSDNEGEAAAPRHAAPGGMQQPAGAAVL